MAAVIVGSTSERFAACHFNHRTILPLDHRQKNVIRHAKQVIGKVFGVAKVGLRLDTVSKIISAIGKAAGVVVNREQNKFASAHDLRRAFGTRWASKLTPAELQQIMRHASINTTLGYYILVDADSLAERLWQTSESHCVQPRTE